MMNQICAKPFNASTLTDELRVGEDNSDPIKIHPELNCASSPRPCLRTRDRMHLLSDLSFFLNSEHLGHLDGSMVARKLWDMFALDENAKMGYPCNSVPVVVVFAWNNFSVSDFRDACQSQSPILWRLPMTFQ